jgi:hypothetical protein
MKILLITIVLTTSMLIFSCSSPTGTCLNCNGDDDKDKNWLLEANVSGKLNFKAQTNEVNYYTHEISGSVFREIKATVFDGTNYHEIYISYLDKPDDDDNYKFDSKNATAIFTTISSEPLLYQYNTTGTLTVLNASDEHITATFNFTATLSDSKQKIEVNGGNLNFRK